MGGATNLTSPNRKDGQKGEKVEAPIASPPPSPKSKAPKSQQGGVENEQ